MSDFQYIAHALRALDSRPALSLESPTHGSETGGESPGTGISSSVDDAAELCEHCQATGWRNRKCNGAPIPCWCDAGDRFRINNRRVSHGR